MPSPQRRPSLRLALLLAAVATAVLAGPALADADLVSTTPADGATTTAPVTEVVATFDEAVESRSTLEVLAGETVVLRGGTDPADPTRIIATGSALAPGTYEARWQAFAHDGHLTRGTFSFTVEAAPTPSPTIAPSATPVDSPSPQTTAAPSPSPSAAPGAQPAGAGDALVPIVAALVLLGGLGLYLLRRQAGRSR